MSKYQLVIVDEDKNYTSRLTSYINRGENHPFMARGFSDPSLIDAYLKTNKVDLLLISTGLYQEVGINHNVKCSLLLSDGKIPNALKELPAVFKYQPVDEIIKALLFHYAEHSGEQLVKVSSKKTQCIGVFSPLGRTGKTSFSLMLSALLANNKEVLYFNLEPFDNLSCYIKTSEQFCLTDLLYYVRQQHPNLSLKLESIKASVIGFDYVMPIRCFIDLKESTIEEWINLIEVIKKETSYDYIILNLSQDLYDYTFELLDYCDDIMTLILPEATAITKYKSWYNTMQLLEKEALLEKINVIYNQISPAYKLFEPLKTPYTIIPYDADFIVKDNDFYLNLQGEVAQSVQKLIKERWVKE